MKKLIAIVDDEPDILELVELHLQKAGFRTVTMENGQELLKFLKDKTPDLIILDLMLPDMNGVEICRELRKDNRFSSVPVIMLTAKSDEVDRVLGLEIGADDYVTKPFSVKELVARVNAHIRREKRTSEIEKIVLGGCLELYPAEYRAAVSGKTVDLTSTEFKILLLLSSRKEKVFTREDIIDHLWGIEKAVLDRTVDVHITNMRKKLGKAGRLIKNIRGIGYKVSE